MKRAIKLMVSFFSSQNNISIVHKNIQLFFLHSTHTQITAVKLHHYSQYRLPDSACHSTVNFFVHVPM